MRDRTCDICGHHYEAVRRDQRYCGKRCRQKANNLRNAPYVARYRAKNPKLYDVICELCGEHARVSAPRLRFCSHDCSVLWKMENGLSGRQDYAKRSKALVHVGPMDVCHLHPKHPARRQPLGRDGVNWTLIVSGPCLWCRDPFTGLAAAITHAPKYCSKRCRVNASRARLGRFVIPPGVRHAIYVRDDFTCQLCFDSVDMTLPPSDAWGHTLDHIVCQSWADDPDHSPANLRLAHRWCNSMRADETNQGHTLFDAA